MAEIKYFGNHPDSIGLISKQPNLTTLTATENGEYLPGDFDAFASVTVNVPLPSFAEKTITEDGEYTAPSGVLWSKVTVSAPEEPSSTLNNNSWPMIKSVCDLGEAGNYWSVGDTKTDVGTDGVTRTFRIADMSGMYGKNVVFEQVGLEAELYAANTLENVDDDQCADNYSISDMRTVVLPAIKAKYSSSLQAVLEDTTYKVAKNADGNEILELTDKLFLPAEKEVLGTTIQSIPDEGAELTQFQWYAAHSTASDRIKRIGETATQWWLRSPVERYEEDFCVVRADGNADGGTVTQTYGVAPCFALGVAPVSQSYEIGFRGMSGSQTGLTRTGEAVGATWSATSGVISIVGIDMEKIWGGYVGNDGEELTWDATNLKYLNGGVEYTGNVFVKLNRFFIKPYYESEKLDGYDLCFAPTAPDSTYEDWFLGKDHCIIGCYKARGGGFSSGLQSKQGLTYTGSCSANEIVTAYKLNSSTAYSLHEKWYNENAILQVLFMAIFATKQTTDVFPEATYRNYSSDTRATGYMDSYRAQSLCAYEPTGDSGKRGNMFLGIEDFVGWARELVCGVKISGTTGLYPSTDYANFSYSNTYTASSCVLPSASENIQELQEDASNPGLLVPKTASGTDYTQYFCDRVYVGSGNSNVWYQGAYDPAASYGVFYFRGSIDASNSNASCAARLCGKPL